MSETENPTPAEPVVAESASPVSEDSGQVSAVPGPAESTATETNADVSAEAAEADFSVKDRRWWARKSKDGAEAEAKNGDAEAKTERKSDADKAVADASAKMIAWLREQLDEKQRMAEEATARQRRALAEMERTKERIERDSARQIELSRRKLIVGFLDVVDDLDRAIDAAHAQTENDDLLDGVELVARRFLTMLEAQGVVRENPSGQEFDPNRHEAVTMVPVADAAQDGKVVGVIKPGYIIGEEVLRPAQVAVGRKG